MRATTTLHMGAHYNVDALEFAGWTALQFSPAWQAGVGQIGAPALDEPYDPDLYFDSTGRYRGPDKRGVEPTFFVGLATWGMSEWGVR